MRILLAALALGLTATSALAATPREVRLSREAMTIEMSDGSLCRLKNWQAKPQGQFTKCGGLGYDIRVDEKTNLLRQLAEGVEKALGGAILAPIAEITLTETSGRAHHFTSPLDIKVYD